MKIYFPFLFLLVSCSSPQVWQYARVKGTSSSFNSAMLVCAADSAFSGVEVQFIKDRSQIVCFLNVKSREIPSLPHDEKRARVVLEIEGRYCEIVAFRMEGGQKVLLPEKAKDLLVNTLTQGKPVHVYLDSFKTELSPESFEKNWAKLN